MIIYTHTETDQAHIYNLRSWWVFGLGVLALLLPIVLALVLGDMSTNSPLGVLVITLFILIWGVLLIDAAPMYLRKYFATLRGKVVTTSGSMLGGGNAQLIIQK